MSRCVCNSCNRPAREDGYCLTHSPERQRQARANNKERFKGYSLRRDYGISIEDYQELFEKQGGVCAICGRPDGDEKGNNNGSKSLAVDHDHETGVVRGLLCSMCNKGIGSLMDSRALLRKAIEYLDAHERSQILSGKLAEDLLEELIADKVE